MLAEDAQTLHCSDWNKREGKRGGGERKEGEEKEEKMKAMEGEEWESE